MKDLNSLKQRINIPPDFLTTVTCNTFRPEYYFNKTDVVAKAISIHKSLVAKDPEGYKTAVFKTLPIMLDVHKVLSAIYLWDNKLVTDGELISILSQVRPDHMADFWITIQEHRKELGLKHKSLSSSARKLLYKFMESIAEERSIRQVALWLMKNKKQWNKAFYYTHTKLHYPDLELLTAKFAFNRKVDTSKIEDPETSTLLHDLESIEELRKTKTLTIKAIEQTKLPYRMLEGLVSGQLQTTTKEWYFATLDKMTNYEVLRRTDAMRRSGFLDEYGDLYRKRVLRMAKYVDPVTIGSIILQHNELLDWLFDPLWDSIESINLSLPQNSVMLCDRSRSMKLKKTRPQPRVLWEIVAYISDSLNIPTYIFNDTPQKYWKDKKRTKIFLIEGSATGPTSISRALLRAKDHNPDWIFLLSDMQQNIPYRGHEKQIANKLDSTIVTLNPTVNPLEPEAATRLETKNEIFLPINGLRQFEQILQVLKEV